MTPLVEFAEHFAMVRQVTAEAAHIPPDLMAAWCAAGPERVEHELAVRLERLAAEGLLEIADARRAAVHYTQLVGGEVNARTHLGALPLSAAETRACVDAGVATFLRAHRPRT